MSPYMKRKQQLKHRILRKFKPYHEALSANRQAELKARREETSAVDLPYLEADLKAIHEKCRVKSAGDVTLLATLKEDKGHPPPARKSRGKKLSKSALAESLREVA